MVTRCERPGRRAPLGKNALLQRRLLRLAPTVLASAILTVSVLAQEARPRARDLGISPGVFEPGPLDAITDVDGVRVGHCTIRQGDSVRTGVTAILPHGGNLFQAKVPAAVDVFNAFGKLAGSTQVQELGQIETPILLTNTLSVWDAAAALVQWTMEMPANQDVRSVNPIVGETNDGFLNDIRGRHVKPEHVREALRSASSGPVPEGAVGAGTGTVAFGWKGGIGTSSRKVPIPGSADSSPGYLVGVLVQSNFGGYLTISGVPVWRSLQPDRKSASSGVPPPHQTEGGSCMIVVATDAPLDARQLRRLAARAVHGMARTGSSGSHGSGDYVIAFSTANRIPADSGPLRTTAVLDENRLSPLFQAVIEATEEAIYNSLLRATDTRGVDGHEAKALPIERLREILRSSR